MNLFSRTVVQFVLFLLPLTGIAQTSQFISFNHDGLTLNGRLMLPAGPGPYKTIIVSPGSGANDRDATLPMLGSNVMCLYPGLYGDTLRPYLGLSQALADSGYAVLTFDKVEYTYPNPAPITFYRLWMPVQSAIAYLGTRTDIDTSNLVLIGHSEGSGTIPYIARTSPNVKALISLAGPRTPLDSLLAYQLKFIANTCGGDTALANAQAAQILSYFADLRSGSWNSMTPPLFGVSASVWNDYVRVMDSVSINYNLANRKTLFIGLGDDINVPPATELSRFLNEVPGADFFSLGGLNHYLTTATDPLVSEALTDTIVFWLRQNLLLHTANIGEPAPRLFVTQNTSGTSMVLHFTRALRTSRITLINMSGKTVYREEQGDGEMSSHTIDISTLPAGLYLVQVCDSQGKVWVEKVVKGD